MSTNGNKPKIILLSRSAVKLAALQRTFPDSIVEQCEPGKTPFAQPLSLDAAFACIDARVAPLMDEIKLSKDDDTTWIAIENYISQADVDGPTPFSSGCVNFVDGVAVGVWRNGALWEYKSSGGFVSIPYEYEYLCRNDFDLCNAVRRKAFDEPKQKKQLLSVLGSNITFGHALHTAHPAECSATDWIPFVARQYVRGQPYRDRNEQICAVLAHVVCAMDEQRALQRACHVYRDYPQVGVVFRDVLPLLSLRSTAQRQMLEGIKRTLCDRLEGVDNGAASLCRDRLFVAGIESRGLLFGIALAQYLDLPFVAIRKAGKLPSSAAWPLVSATYEKEYGTDTLELQKRHIDEALNGEQLESAVDSDAKGQEEKEPRACILVDDVLATGGSMCAAASLMSQCAVEIAAVVVIDDVPSFRLQRSAKFFANDVLRNVPIVSVL